MKQGMGGFVVLCGILVLASTGYSGLVHRYAFDGNADDSVGYANGTLVNATGAAAYADGKLDLKNTGTPTSTASNINYVDLPNGIISALGENATFEAWVTWNGPSNTWQRIFDFGTSDSGEGFAGGASNSTYLFMTPLGGGGVYRIGYRRGAELGGVEERTIDGTAALPIGQEVHVALVWDGIGQQVRLYLNGQLLNTGVPHFSLTQLPDVNNWLGRSQWPDPTFDGVFNEFRIYDIALDDAQIQESYAAGPDSPPTTFINLPTNPTPANGGANVATNATLNWVSSDSPLITGHQVYLGTDKTAVQNATTGTAGIYRGTVGPSLQSFNPGPLEMRTSYYWKIVETTSEGKTVSGAVWSFRTIDLLPALVSPLDRAGNISDTLGVTLEWTTPSAAGGTMSISGRIRNSLSRW
jgi:hypothetical protein